MPPHRHKRFDRSHRDVHKRVMGPARTEQQRKAQGRSRLQRACAAGCRNSQGPQGRITYSEDGRTPTGFSRGAGSEHTGGIFAAAKFPEPTCSRQGRRRPGGLDGDPAPMPVQGVAS